MLHTHTLPMKVLFSQNHIYCGLDYLNQLGLALGWINDNQNVGYSNMFSVVLHNAWTKI